MIKTGAKEDIIVKVAKILIVVAVSLSAVSCGDYSTSYGKRRVHQEEEDEMSQNEIVMAMRDRDQVWGEEQVWELAMEQDNLDAYKFYIGHFPNGQHVRRAERRIWTLKQRADRKRKRAIEDHHDDLQGEDTKGDEVTGKMEETRERADRYNEGLPPCNWLERLFGACD